jgi:hypothetical protein
VTRGHRQDARKHRLAAKWPAFTIAIFAIGIFAIGIDK